MAASSASSNLSRNPNFIPSFKRHTPSPLSFHNTLKLPNTTTASSTKFLKHTFKTTTAQAHASPLFTARGTTRHNGASSTESTIFHGLCYVVGDNIDTDQIIPSEYLTFVPSNPDEYKKLGSYALSGLPSSYTTRFIESGKFYSEYSILIGGDNFGCGSSREHAPVALGVAGVKAVVAESYARIFFRNSVATGEVYPLESEGRLCEECKTGDVVTIRLPENLMTNHSTGKEYILKHIGDAGPVIQAGGIFTYARKTGMIPSSASC